MSPNEKTGRHIWSNYCEVIPRHTGRGLYDQPHCCAPSDKRCRGAKHPGDGSSCRFIQCI
jgi:hypothetical protein